MPLPALIFSLLVSIAPPEDPPITVRGYPWAPFISPMGEPFRGGPNRQAPIARWFERADANRDGVLTADEMQADADRFFKRLDSSRDGRIDPQEITAYEWEIAPDIQVNSDWKRPRGQAAPAGEKRRKRDEDRYDGYQVDGLQGAARYGLLNIPQPVASADADFNRVVTRIEVMQAAAIRFGMLDPRRQGRITLPELEARLPTRPEGRKPKRDKDAVDGRIGLPLPKED